MFDTWPRRLFAVTGAVLSLIYTALILAESTSMGEILAGFVVGAVPVVFVIGILWITANKNKG